VGPARLVVCNLPDHLLDTGVVAGQNGCVVILESCYCTDRPVTKTHEGRGRGRGLVASRRRARTLLVVADGPACVSAHPRAEVQARYGRATGRHLTTRAQKNVSCESQGFVSGH